MLDCMGGFWYVRTKTDIVNLVERFRGIGRIVEEDNIPPEDSNPPVSEDLRTRQVGFEKWIHPTNAPAGSRGSSQLSYYQPYEPEFEDVTPPYLTSGPRMILARKNPTVKALHLPRLWLAVSSESKHHLVTVFPHLRP